VTSPSHKDTFKERGKDALPLHSRKQEKKRHCPTFKWEGVVIKYVCEKEVDPFDLSASFYLEDGGGEASDVQGKAITERVKPNWSTGLQRKKEGKGR